MTSSSKPLPLALLLAFLGLLSLRVEDGQFTREYSRLYTALVLSMGGILLLLVGIGVWQAWRRRVQGTY